MGGHGGWGSPRRRRRTRRTALVERTLSEAGERGSCILGWLLPDNDRCRVTVGIRRWAAQESPAISLGTHCLHELAPHPPRLLLPPQLLSEAPSPAAAAAAATQADSRLLCLASRGRGRRVPLTRGRHGRCRHGLCLGAVERTVPQRKATSNPRHRPAGRPPLLSLTPALSRSLAPALSRFDPAGIKPLSSPTRACAHARARARARAHASLNKHGRTGAHTTKC